MKKMFKAGVLLFALMVLVSGCSDKSGKEDTPDEPAQILYPITINGSEILLGETTVQTLLDAGLRVTVSEMTADKKINQYEVDPESELDANSYYSGGSVWITDAISAHIALVTDETAIRMGDAVIARLEFNLISGEKSDHDKITFNGVPVSEITNAKARVMFPQLTGDDNFLLEYGDDYDYSMQFSAEDGSLTKLSATKNYDIDWSSDTP